MKAIHPNWCFAGLIPFIILAGCSGIKKTAQTGNSKQSPVELKVMTYNVHHCNPPSRAKEGVIELDAIAKVIAAATPDIVFLQEIDDHTTRSGKNINQAEALATQLGMHYYFGKAIDFAGGGYGIAILCKFNLSESRVYLLPRDTSKKSEQRALLTATATLDNNLKIRLACTHLDVVSAENRRTQAGKIVDVLHNDSLPVLLGGDFNDTLNSKAIHTLLGAFQSVCHPCMPTDPADKPEDAIDFIFTGKKHKWQVLTYYVGEDHYASDHRPVMAKLYLQ